MTPRSMLKRLGTAAAAVVAIAAVAAPTAATAAADAQRVLTTTIQIPRLEIHDAYLSNACGLDVSARISGRLDKKVVFDDADENAPARESDWFVGRITWFTDAGKSYSSTFANRSRIEYPEGIGLFKPARIKLTGAHGGTFPIGDGPPGRGLLVYDAFVYAIDEAGFPLTAVLGDPIEQDGNFEGATARICAALS
jgi:hypothetical protein